MSNELKQYIADIPDFPREGILFRDINPLLRDHFDKVLTAMSDLLAPIQWEKIDAVCGIESRGFILAAGLAAKHNKGLIPIRKPGKLPGKVMRVNYQLEYGEDALEMARAEDNKRIILVDDVLATGGTLKAATELAEKTAHQVEDIIVLINLKNLNNFNWQEKKIKAVLEYE